MVQLVQLLLLRLLVLVLLPVLLLVLVVLLLVLVLLLSLVLVLVLLVLLLLPVLVLLLLLLLGQHQWPSIFRVAECEQANSTARRVACFGRLNLFFDAALVIITTSAFSLETHP